MNIFKEIIDTYLINYSTYKNGKVVFEYEYGELIFLKENPKIITLFSIYIFPEYRKQGLCRNILQYLIDKSSIKFQYLCIQSVLSKILYEYLERFEYINKKFKNKKDGWFFKLF
jgi:hypothetical protein